MRLVYIREKIRMDSKKEGDTDRKKDGEERQKKVGREEKEDRTK